MIQQSRANVDVKLQSNIDSALLRLVCTSNTPISRTDLAQLTGLSKMTISNHVAQFIEQNIFSERFTEAREDYSRGRKPVSLIISSKSPCIFGILIHRKYCQSILTDIAGNIIDMAKTVFPDNMTKDQFIRFVLSHYDVLHSRSKRRIIGCGISSIGPISTITGSILNPPNFYQLSDIPIEDIFQQHTGLPAYLLHDAAAGALVEKLYGNGKQHDNFVFLYISQGIGAGFILNGKLFSGVSGQSGEIGHSSINCNGPKCSCGNSGCLEVYASLAQMKKKAQSLCRFFPDSPLNKLREPVWLDFVTLAAAADPIAVAALDEFCEYLAIALANTLKLLDFTTLIIGYATRPGTQTHIIEKILYDKFHRLPQFFNLNLQILHSYFDGDAPLLGATAVIANEVFEQNIPLT